MTDVYQNLFSTSIQYPKDPNYVPSYGTAGFRTDARLLRSVVFRCGVLAALRALNLQKHIGLMITASHNPERDNGVKIVEPMGDMLDSEWEKYATDMACIEDNEKLCQYVKDLIKQKNIQLHSSSKVFIGMDTRASGPQLVSCAIAGVKSLYVTSINLGENTTPELHFIVRNQNMGVDANEKTYVDTLSKGYHDFIKCLHIQQNVKSFQRQVNVDCANGVGGDKLELFQSPLQDSLELNLLNNGEGKLNFNCGSDHVVQKRLLPHEFDDVADNECCASIDGDADRVVFFYKEKSQLKLLDGDKISTLSAIYFKNKLKDILEQNDFSISVVQTAYANGASTNYMKNELGINSAITPTGVKHLHHEAIKHDIGIYFEANGHGTVLFSKRFLDYVKLNSTIPNIKEISGLVKVINQAVGDAISGILMVDLMLRSLSMNLDDWSKLYTDLPSKQIKVQVRDRQVVQTTNAETICVKPDGLQEQITKLCAKFQYGRSFVRPSGTEDVVRVYAESTTQESTDEFALQVAKAVHQMAGGIGPSP